MTPLSEESLREKIVEILKEQEVVLHNASVDLAKKGIIPRPKAAILNDTATKIVALQLQDRQAYGEQVKEIIKMSDTYTFEDGTVFVRNRKGGE